MNDPAVIQAPIVQVRATLMSLFDSKEAMASLVLGSERALRESFQQRPLRGGQVTAAEKKHRATLCIEIARVLRGDCKWSVDRVVDHLPKYLLQAIDGIDWKPPTRNVWAPDSV